MIYFVHLLHTSIYLYFSRMQVAFLGNSISLACIFISVLYKNVLDRHLSGGWYRLMRPFSVQISNKLQLKPNLAKPKSHPGTWSTLCAAVWGRCNSGSSVLNGKCVISSQSNLQDTIYNVRCKIPTQIFLEFRWKKWKDSRENRNGTTTFTSISACVAGQDTIT